jgi:hypothetical protein
MFGLKTNYRELIYEIVEMLLKDEKVTVLLIPPCISTAWI